jgi:hypothetical protein
MADQLSGVASGATGQSLGAPLGGLSGALQGGVSTLMNGGQGMLDRWFPPEKRENLYAKITKFATEKPMLASFLLSQIALSGVPLALFAVMTVGVAIFALVAALLIAVVRALLFIVFCVGVALIILLPTLFITTFAAAFIWLWGVGAYYILKHFNQTDIPGIHTGLDEGLVDQSGVKDALPEGMPDMNGNGEAKGPRQYDMDEGEEHGQGEDEDEKAPHKPPKLKDQGGAEKKGSGQNSNIGKTTGANIPQAGNVTKKMNAGSVMKGVDGVKGQLPLAGGAA